MDDMTENTHLVITSNLTEHDLTTQVTHILETASDLIIRYGFDKTTMDEIAREAGVSKSALYLIWSSKDQLLSALLAYQMRRLLLDFSARLEADPDGGRIANLYRHALLALKSNPLMAAMYTRDSRLLGDFVHQQDVTRYNSRIMLGLTAITQMQAAGLLQQGIRPEVITYVLSIISLGFIHIQSIVPTAEAPPLDEVAEAISHLMEHGFAGTSEGGEVGKQAILNIVDLAIRQYDEELAKTKR